MCLLYEKDFTTDEEGNPVKNPIGMANFLVGEKEQGAACNCYVESDYVAPGVSVCIAMAQNPHLALWCLTEEPSKVDQAKYDAEDSALNKWLGQFKAGYVRPCGCFEVLTLS